MRNNCCVVLSGADTASVNGNQIDANQIVSASFHCYFGDATATGTFKLQASNDPCTYGNIASVFVVTNWVDIPSQTVAIASGGAQILTIANSTYRWLRAVFTRSGGGSTTVVVNMNSLSI